MTLRTLRGGSVYNGMKHVHALLLLVLMTAGGVAAAAIVVG